MSCGAAKRRWRLAFKRERHYRILETGGGGLGRVTLEGTGFPNFGADAVDESLVVQQLFFSLKRINLVAVHCDFQITGRPSHIGVDAAQDKRLSETLRGASEREPPETA